MDIYRRSNLFERFFAFVASPSSPTSCAKKILQLLYRCTYVGGSTTLITRCGLLGWVQSELALNQDAVERSFLHSLARRALDTCDKERVNEWSGGNVASLLVNAGIETQLE